MDCKRAQQAIAELLGEELPSGRRPALDAHLAVCGGCRSMFDEAREALGWLDAALSAPPAALQPRAAPPASRGRWRAALRYAAIFALAFACGWAVRSPAAPTQHAQPVVLPAPQQLNPPASQWASAVVAAHQRNPRRSGLAAGMSAVLALE